jgi:putative hydrolase of the HAD superfamily
MASPSHLKAVLLDLDDTLIPEAEPLTLAYQAVAEAVWGPQATEQQALDIRSAAREYWDAHAPEPEYRERVHLGPSDGLSSQLTGDGTERAELREFVRDFHAHAFDAALPDGFAGDSATLRQVFWAARLSEQTIFPDAIELLETLRESYKLALVTNGASDFQREKINGTDLGQYFDAIIVSGDLGTGKPDPAPFYAALAALDVNADEVVMIGNDKARDIAGADRAGIRSIWVQPGDPTQTDAVTDLLEIPSLLAG